MRSIRIEGCGPLELKKIEQHFNSQGFLVVEVGLYDNTGYIFFADLETKDPVSAIIGFIQRDAQIRKTIKVSPVRAFRLEGQHRIDIPSIIPRLERGGFLVNEVAVSGEVVYIFLDGEETKDPISFLTDRGGLHQGSCSSRLSVITTCMGRLEHVKRTAPLVMAQKGIEYVFVDWSCPENSGAWIKERFPGARVVGIKGQKYFNMAKARNAGGFSASCEWLCFLDADLIVNQKFSEIILSKIKQGKFLRHPKINTVNFNGFVVCSREIFNRIGGYDERCEGWGWEDSEYYERMKELGEVEEFLPDDTFNCIDHEDALRNKFFEIKDMNKSWTRNKGLPKRHIQ